MDKHYKIIHPVKYYRDYLAHDIRPDGRELLDFRPVVINIGSVTNADGSATVKIGNTVVICGIKAELAKPKPQEPDQGYLIPNVELPPLCSQKFRPGPPSDQAQVTSDLVARIIDNSSCVNLQDLCICPDKLAWVLYCDMICLDYNGSIVDACLLALVAALKTISLPEIEYGSECDTISVHDDKRKSIKIHSIPIATTFAVFDDKVLLADPTNDEEILCSGIVTVAIADDSYCSVHKPGGSPLSEDQIKQCIVENKKQAKLVKSLLDTALHVPDR